MELVCRLLEVSRSGYYEWLGRKPSLRRQKDQELKRRLLSLHQRYCPHTRFAGQKNNLYNGKG